MEISRELVKIFQSYCQLNIWRSWKPTHKVWRTWKPIFNPQGLKTPKTNPQGLKTLKTKQQGLRTLKINQQDWKTLKTYPRQKTNLSLKTNQSLKTNPSLPCHCECGLMLVTTAWLNDEQTKSLSPNYELPAGNTKGESFKKNNIIQYSIIADGNTTQFLPTKQAYALDQFCFSCQYLERWDLL